MHVIMNKPLLFALSLSLLLSCAGKTEPTVIELQGIALNKHSLELTEGQSEALSVTFTPTSATNKQLTWQSSNPSVVTVSNGVVLGISSGSADVIARSGSYSDKCAVTVKPNVVELQSITLSKHELVLDEGQSETLTVKFTPENATDKRLTWDSINPSVATVKDGVVVGVSAGSTVITVKCGSYSDKCSVTIEPAIVVLQKITLDKHEIAITEGQSETLSVTFTPENATDKQLTWESSNPSIATVDDGVVSGVSPGSIDITVRCGEHSDKCAVIVRSTNVVIFEDSNFKAYCVASFDKDGDKEVSYAEAENVESMDFSTNDISSIKGIEYFTNLIKLSCKGSIDTSSGGGKGKLTSIDVSAHTKLNELICEANQLTSIDVSQNIALLSLNCGHNILTSIDVSNNKQLKWFNCEANQLTSIDLSNNTLLSSLSCAGNQLTELDVRRNLYLDKLDCTNNPSLHVIRLMYQQNISSFDYDESVSTLVYESMLIRTIHDIPRVKNFLVQNGFTEINHKDLKYQDTILADLNNRTYFIVDGDGMYAMLCDGTLALYYPLTSRDAFINYVKEMLGIE